MFTELRAVRINQEFPEESKRDALHRVRKQLHQEFIDSLETDGAELLADRVSVVAQIQWLISNFEETQNIEFDPAEKAQLESEILVELDGLGPLAPLMLDSSISDILINGPTEVWVDRSGKLERTELQFDDEAHIRRLLDRVLASQGKSLDQSNPMVDAKLPDGSRLHAVAPPLSASGTVISIRRFQNKQSSVENLLRQGFMTDAMLTVLRAAVESGMNIIISGGAAAGKTSLVNLLSTYIPKNERVITIEESKELNLRNSHVISLESRPSNTEGRGEIGLRELLRTALRMRADRIVVGEVRGLEVLDMLQAMNVGHNGSLTTVHANSAADVIPRLEMLALLGDKNLVRESIREMIGSAIQLIVHLSRDQAGKRRISSICYVNGKSGNLDIETLFDDKQDVNTSDLRIKQLSFLADIEARGFDISAATNKVESIGARRGY